MAAGNNTSGIASGARLKEILGILKKHSITKGLTPEKLRHILEDLGPTYIKLGQIMSMRTDMIPASFCDELAKLRSEVAPMSFGEVRSVVESSCGSSLNKLFSSFNEKPLGSASIAQVHLAELKDGSRVVVKVQRIGVYNKMARDIALLRRASVLLKLAGGMGEVVDFGMVLDELWAVAQEEMNFLIEARNAEEFYKLNQDVAYVTCPHIYRNISTSSVLVMEYIDGYAINDIEALTRNGYSMNEIGTKLVDNYMKQIIDFGFFHADPHPGNIKIRDGKIVWIDMGMMGRISARDQELINTAIMAIAKHDIGTVKDVVLAIGICRGKVNHSNLYTDIDDILTKYGSMDLGSMDAVRVIEDIIELTRAHQISMPAGISMLGRGVATMEGVLAHISPDINLLEITANRISSSIIKHIDWKKELTNGVSDMLDSGRKALGIPSLVSDLLKMSMKGQTKVNMELHSSIDFEKTIDRLLGKLIIGLLVSSLLVGSSLICTTDMKPKLLGIPVIGAFGYFSAIVLTMWLFYDARRKK